MQKIYELLSCKIDKNRVLQNESMKKHTSLNIGGTADVFIIVNTIQELKYVLEVATKEKIKVTILRKRYEYPCKRWWN